MEFCNDCRYYLPVDVFKGICKISKEKILPEDKACKEYRQIPKCKFCSNYTSVKNDIGKCMNRADAYPEMIAITCEDFMINK